MKSLHIKRILVPIDFSDNSMNALHTATSVARRHGASIKLLFAHNRYEMLYPQINLNNGHAIIKSLTALAKLVKKDDNVFCNFSYIMGDVSSSIIHESNEEKADLIIIGKNGNSGKRKMFAGSNAYAVIRKCTCPVLMVPSGKIWTQFNHVLFPVRPSLSMLEKYSMIKEILNKNNSTVHILNLRNPDYINELHIISNLVHLLKIKFKEDNIKTSLSYYFKDEKFAAKILAVAHDTKFKIDLLVITSEDNSTENAFYLSSYAQQIVHGANVPLMIIKPETFAHSKDVVLKELEKQMHPH